MALLDHTPMARVLELVSRFDARGPRYTSYPTVPAWRNDVQSSDVDAARDRVASEGRPIALYLHLPFCAKRCLYCGCNSYISRNTERIERYVDALLLEVEQVGERLAGPSGRPLSRRSLSHSHLHLGGGTPTHLSPKLLARLLDAVIERFPGATGVARSVEVDPRECTGEHLEVLAARSFRRLSLGVQDLDLRVQQAVRRIQPEAQLRALIAKARELGFESVNIDLIYGLPQQTPEPWRHTLESVARIAPDRLACFGYAHLPERIKHQRALDIADMPGSRERLAMLLDAGRVFAEAGYDSIGLDHFAHPDDELARAQRDGRLWRNFMGYTTTRGLQLVGLGCSAISEFDELFCQNEVQPERYAELVRDGKPCWIRGHRLDDDDRYRKALISDLMGASANSWACRRQATCSSRSASWRRSRSRGCSNARPTAFG
jgi:oxygen-independent coproporphyrinogen-3 oxidase